MIKNKELFSFIL